MKQTSRHRLVDGLESIQNLIAYASHLQEVANSYGVNEKVTEADRDFCLEFIDRSIELRRDAMQKIQKEFSGDMLYWCAVKHAIAQRWLATEMLYTNTLDEELISIQQRASELMYATISKFTNQEVVTCWRCMADALEAK